MPETWMLARRWPGQRVTHTMLPPPRSWSEHGQHFGLLQCGEILAKVGGRGRPFERLRDHYHAASVIIDVAHADVALSSFVSWNKAIDATSRVGKQSRPVLVSQHLATEYLSNCSKNYSDNGQARRSSPVVERGTSIESISQSGRPTIRRRWSMCTR